MNTKVLESAKLLQDQLEVECPGSTVLFMCLAGSHFFDLHTEKSDLDFRGVYMPSAQQLMEGQWRAQVNLDTKEFAKQKNSKDDVDCTFFSLDEFCSLVASGDFNMLELLYSPEDKVLVNSEEFKFLQHTRESYTPLDLSAFLGFVRRELKTYALEPNSFERLTKFRNFLSTKPMWKTLNSYWFEVEEWCKSTDFAKTTEAPVNRGSTMLPAVQLAGRMFLGTDKTSVLCERLDEILSHFGHRKKMQAENTMDFKGVSHAFRLLYEAEDLMTTGRLHFPFSPEKLSFLKQLKMQELDVKDFVDPFMEKLQLVQEHDDLVHATNTNLKSYKKDMDTTLQNYSHTVMQRYMFKNQELINFPKKKKRQEKRQK